MMPSITFRDSSSSFKNSPSVQSSSRTRKLEKRSSYGLGKLRFQRTHGMLGIFSLPSVLWALYMVKTTTATTTLDLTTILSVSLAILSTAALAISAIPMLKQVPKSTVISKRWRIIPPHKEAFRRTVAIVGYLDLRLANELFKIILLPGERRQLSEDWQSWFAKGLCMYYLWFFFPRGSFDNGNTWVFVVPMSIGFGVDVYHQLSSNWMHWNDSVVTVEYLLLTLLSSQIVAFMFTLGFRDIVPIRYGYWIAALVVFMLCAGMGVNYSSSNVMSH
ncbi:unnamed protein product [Cylindrotheca closterium]|uniref:Uncharacterized protein n=1 Tax=Cylindrotheca closterium TaxID=2856 RepID=A0AAD2FMX4_9STRA|nr:unnamed protein product [Cylindrotheca closterium]